MTEVCIDIANRICLPQHKYFSTTERFWWWENSDVKWTRNISHRTRASITKWNIHQPRVHVIIFPVEWKSVLLFVKFDYWTFINIIKYFVNKRSTKYISNLNFIFLNPDVIWIFWLFIWANSKIFRLLGDFKIP